MMELLSYQPISGMVAEYEPIERVFARVAEENAPP
jgi:hypothetical protein